MAYNNGKKPKAKKRGAAITGQKRQTGKKSPFAVTKTAVRKKPIKPTKKRKTITRKPTEQGGAIPRFPTY